MVSTQMDSSKLTFFLTFNIFLDILMIYQFNSNLNLTLTCNKIILNYSTLSLILLDLTAIFISKEVIRR